MVVSLCVFKNRERSGIGVDDSMVGTGKYRVVQILFEFWNTNAVLKEKN